MRRLNLLCQAAIQGYKLLSASPKTRESCTFDVDEKKNEWSRLNDRRTGYMHNTQASGSSAADAICLDITPLVVSDSSLSQLPHCLSIENSSHSSNTHNNNNSNNYNQKNSNGNMTIPSYFSVRDARDIIAHCRQRDSVKSKTCSTLTNLEYICDCFHVGARNRDNVTRVVKDRFMNNYTYGSGGGGGVNNSGGRGVDNNDRGEDASQSWDLLKHWQTYPVFFMDDTKASSFQQQHQQQQHTPTFHRSSSSSSSSSHSASRACPASNSSSSSSLSSPYIVEDSFDMEMNTYSLFPISSTKSTSKSTSVSASKSTSSSVFSYSTQLSQSKLPNHIKNIRISVWLTEVFQGWNDTIVVQFSEQFANLFGMLKLEDVELNELTEDELTQIGMKIGQIKKYNMCRNALLR